MKIAKLINRYPGILLLILALLGYWQLTGMVDPLKWDNMDAYHPYRYFISECIRNHEFPFWNPYQFLGYPIYSDPGSGAWYPLLWLISLLMPYSYVAMNIEFLLHIFIGGYGVYRLCTYLKLNPVVAFVPATLYMFTGFMVETAQMIVFTIAMAWWPLVILTFLQMTEKRSRKSVWLFSLFVSLLVTGGYPAFTIIVFYVLLAIALYQLVKLWLNKQPASMIPLLGLWGSSMLIIGAATSGYWYALIRALPHFTRGTSLEYDEAVFSYSMNIPSLLSLLTPVNNAYDEHFAGNDFVYAYMGLLTLLLLALFLFIRKDRTQLIIFFSGIVFLAASFGKDLPLRYWLYRTLPGMDLFRHPVIFFAFAQLCFTINAAYALQHLAERYAHGRNRIRYVLFFLLSALFLTAFIVDWKTISGGGSFFEIIGGIDLASGYSQAARSVIHLLLMVLVFAILLAVVLRSASSKTFLLILTCGMVADALLSLQLNMERKVTAHFPLQTAERQMEELPKGFPLPDLQLKVNQVNDSMLNFPVPEIWKNLNIYSKRVASDGYAPFILNHFDQLRHSSIRSSTLAHPLVFLSDRLLPMSQQQQTGQEAAIYAADSVAGELIEKNWLHLPTDSLRMSSFAPGKVSVKVKLAHPQLITLLQNHFPGWEVRIDEQKVAHFISNHTTISAVVPAGEHTVSFLFSDPLAEKLFLLSMLITLLLIAFSAAGVTDVPSLKKGSLYFVVAAIAAAGLYGLNTPFEEIREDELNHLRTELQAFRKDHEQLLSAVLNVDDVSGFDKHLQKTQLRFKESSLLGQEALRSVVDRATTPYFAYLRYNLYDPSEALAIINDQYPYLQRKISVKYGSLLIFHRQEGTSLKGREWSNSFEEEGQWGMELRHTDTTFRYEGKRSFKMNETVPYGPVFEWIYEQKKGLRPVLDITVALRPDSGSAPAAGIVFMVKKEEKEVWKHMDVQPCLERTGEWQRLTWSVDLRGKAVEKDTIKVYVWNRGKEEFFIDNMNISLRKYPEL